MEPFSEGGGVHFTLNVCIKYVFYMYETHTECLIRYLLTYDRHFDLIPVLTVTDCLY